MNEESRNKIWHCNDFLFYFRNIQNDINQYKIWSKLQPLFTYDSYLDCDPSDDDINLLERLINNVPNVIKNLQGLSISQQILLVKKLFKSFEEDLTVALALLENKKLDPDITLDDQTKLILELSVRIEIVNNNYDFDKILGLVKSPDDIFKNNDNLPF